MLARNDSEIEALNDKAMLLKIEKKFTEAIAVLKQSLSLQEVDIDKFTPKEWRRLAFTQSQLIALAEEQHKLYWVKQVIFSYKQITKDQKSIEDRMVLASYYNEAGIHASKKGYQYHYQALTLVEDIPESERTDSIKRSLATYQYNLGIASTENVEVIKWYEKAIHTLTLLSKKEGEDCIDLALYHHHLASQFSYFDRKKYLYTSLNFIVKAAQEKKFEFDLTAKNYKILSELFLPYSLENKLFSFAHTVFSNGIAKNKKNDFLHLYFNIFNKTPSVSTEILSQMQQFMNLLLLSYKEEAFHCFQVKKWLSDPKELSEFKLLLHEITQAAQPASLLQSIGETPSFSVAVANKLLLLEKEMVNLKEDVHFLRSENNKLARELYYKNNNRNLMWRSFQPRPRDENTDELGSALIKKKRCE